MARDRLAGALEKLVAWFTRERPFLKLYPASVVVQNADGTLDLLPEDEAIRGGGLQGIPIRHGLPGVTVQVGAGQRVRVGFDGADRRAPYAALWDTAGTAKVGSLLVVQNAQSMALLPPQWFAAGTSGNAAAQVALAAALAAGNVAYLVPLTVPVVEVP